LGRIVSVGTPMDGIFGNGRRTRPSDQGDDRPQQRDVYGDSGWPRSEFQRGALSERCHQGRVANHPRLVGQVLTAACDAGAPMKISFLGATGTVTGSKYLVEIGSKHILVDCGLFQGFKQLRLRNWKPVPFPAREIDAVILTHAHIDHSGYLPLLLRQGFTGRVYCTHATRELLGVLLPDSARLQEEEAAYANRRGYSKHHPALPLYTQQDAV